MQLAVIELSDCLLRTCDPAAASRSNDCNPALLLSSDVITCLFFSVFSLLPVVSTRSVSCKEFSFVSQCVAGKIQLMQSRNKAISSSEELE